MENISEDYKLTIMKELSIEEKAKLYDEAIERAKNYYSITTPVADTELIELLFPELKESEDERTRKRIIALVDAHGQGMYKDEMLAWLEKPTWNKEDDSKRNAIIQFIEDNYLSYSKNKEPIEWLDWLKSLKGRVQPHPKQGEQKLPIEKLPFEMKTVSESLGFTSKKECDDYNKMVTNLIMSDDKGEQKPAEWSSEQSKTLQTDDVPKESSTATLLRTGAIGFDGEPMESKPCKQNPTWSEEDELHIRELESLVKQVWATADENDKDTIHKMSDLSFFLKTLKPQLKQEWSEEDEKMLNQIIKDYERGNESWLKGQGSLPFGNRITWLKSLRPQNTWKPSDEQMKALWDSIPENVKEISEREMLLDSLYQDLKKLREE